MRSYGHTKTTKKLAIKPRQLTVEEINVWEQAIKETVPLPDLLDAESISNEIKKIEIRLPQKLNPQKSFSLPVQHQLFSNEDIASKKVQQVSLRLQSKLLKRHHISKKIDLHNMTQDQAFTLVDRIIRDAFHKEQRILLFITGKGTLQKEGILRAMFPKWLESPDLRPFMNSYCHAHPHDGGDGAWYVFIKRNRHS